MSKDTFQSMTEEQQKMVMDNYNLIYHVLKFFPFTKEKQEDYEQIGALALCKAVMSFDETKGNKFSTYAIPYIKFSIITYYRTFEVSSIKLSPSKYKEFKENKDNGLIVTSYDYLIENEYLKEPGGSGMDGKATFQSNSYESGSEVVGNIFVEQILDTLDDKERELFEYLLSGYNQTEIAAMYDCTRANINIRVQKIRKKLKDIIEDFDEEEDMSSDEIDLDDISIYDAI